MRAEGVSESNQMPSFRRIQGMIELIVGLLIVSTIALVATLFATRSKAGEVSGTPDKPRNKANADQPQEEFIGPRAGGR
jgi:hypothetical protein